MEDPKERLVTSISTAELERRWKAAREWMKEEGVDYLLMRNDEEYLGTRFSIPPYFDESGRLSEVSASVRT